MSKSAAIAGPSAAPFTLSRRRCGTRLAFGLLAALLPLAGCGRRAHATPEDAVRALIKGLNENDTDAVLFALPQRIRNMAKKGKHGYDGITRLAVAGLKFVLKGGEVIGSEVDGTNATVRVKVSGVEMPIKCIKEGSGWKVGAPL